MRLYVKKPAWRVSAFFLTLVMLLLVFPFAGTAAGDELYKIEGIRTNIEGKTTSLEVYVDEEFTFSTRKAYETMGDDFYRFTGIQVEDVAVQPKNWADVTFRVTKIATGDSDIYTLQYLLPLGSDVVPMLWQQVAPSWQSVAVEKIELQYKKETAKNDEFEFKYLDPGITIYYCDLSSDGKSVTFINVADKAVSTETGTLSINLPRNKARVFYVATDAPGYGAMASFDAEGSAGKIATVDSVINGDVAVKGMGKDVLKASAVTAKDRYHCSNEFHFSTNQGPLGSAKQFIISVSLEVLNYKVNYQTDAGTAPTDKADYNIDTAKQELSLIQVANAPTAQKGLAFSGWALLNKDGNTGAVYQPGSEITVNKQMILQNASKVQTFNFKAIWMQDSDVVITTEDFDTRAALTIGFTLTGPDGFASQENLTVEGSVTLSVDEWPDGVYTLEETTPPAGYEGEAGLAVSFELQSGKIVAASTNRGGDRVSMPTPNTLKIRNKQSGGVITVSQNIAAGGINWENGNPIFLFKLTNVATHAENYRVAEFANSDPTKDVYLTETVIFDELPNGTYTVTAEQALRYNFSNIIGVHNGKVAGETITFTISAKNQTGAVTYVSQNKMPYYCSDTAVLATSYTHAGAAGGGDLVLPVEPPVEPPIVPDPPVESMMYDVMLRIPDEPYSVADDNLYGFEKKVPKLGWDVYMKTVKEGSEVQLPSFTSKGNYWLLYSDSSAENGGTIKITNHVNLTGEWAKG